ncbi:hypothetical protein M404DRAFT_17019 [Pisolithus tinctorius Marx 270]|uniref:Alpha-type protein kinase domain-containing protein n=1 Tax=Pisolithus tinctorius Marx 270 TaxID=870435 RepID=A0A0C3N3W3_PISTI|nr:hypothetical protein M404DRAFT_17019 [Pisolithus tinctorius Marx 270]
MAILSWCEASDGDGCGQIFPHKTQPGICAKCHKLASFQAGSADIKLWQVMPQCKGCGMVWKNLQGEMCGTCETISAMLVGNCDSSTGTSQVMHDAIETARQAWAVSASVGLQKSPNTSGLPNTLNTTAGLNYAWNGGGQPGSDKIKIAIERSNAGDAYGKWMKLWAKDVYLTMCGRGEVQFHFPGNKNFQPGDQTKAVGYVYNAYMLGKSADFYKPRDAQSKELSLTLYLYSPSEIQGLRSCKGHPAVDHSSNEDTTLRTVTCRPHKKVRCGHLGLTSTFIPTPSLTSLSHTTSGPSTSVTFLCAVCSMVPETGEVEIVWPDDSVETIKGFLGSDVFSKGWTKKVYKLMLNRDLFVAKCFFDIGTGESMTTTDNKKYLEAELVRLNLGKWFLGHFCELAKQQGVSIFSEIVFSEGFLLCEHEMLSAASGESDHGNYYGGAVWLVKPRQTTTVMKFSDTLEHPSSMDKLRITISAFAHFAYEYSKHKLVFADIQDGIKIFMQQHQCDYICVNMGLPSIVNTHGDEA